jgi:hypothetical protein
MTTLVNLSSVVCQGSISNQPHCWLPVAGYQNVRRLIADLNGLGGGGGGGIRELMSESTNSKSALATTVRH